MAASRKKILIGVGICLVIVIVVAVLCGVLIKDDDDDDERMLTNKERAMKILAEAPLIDGHNNLPWQIRSHFFNRFANLSIEKTFNEIHTDIPRLKEGKVGAQFWAALVSCANQYKNSVRLVLEQIDAIHRLVEKYPNDFMFVETADQITQAKKDGKIGSLIGVIGGHCIDNSLDTLRALYQLGARYMSLTHSCNTPWADSCCQKSEHNGLTEFGKTIVREMNRLGMFVDLSNSSPKTMKDTLDVTTAPVIFSHSSAHALCNNSGNVPDDILRRMSSNGGVVMVSFNNEQITCKKQANISNVADHIDYIKNITGVDHVGLGANYDGDSSVPTGLEDVSKYPDLLAELIRRGYTDEEIKKIAGGNLIRAMKAMEKASTQLDSTVPFDDFIFVNKTCRPNFQGGYDNLKIPVNPWAPFQ